MARGKTLFNFGNYTFASWARRGLANAIVLNGSTLVRANVPLTIQLNDESIPQTIELMGPADIAGILRDAIVRTEPLNGNYNFEWNMLPYIEFYDEDFAWRYTPDAPDATTNNLRPWLALVVLKGDEFQQLDVEKGMLPAIRVQTSTLPPSADLHLWAHMHTGEHAGVSGDLNKILLELSNNFAQDPDGVTCRLLSPRRLDKKTMYHAFLIPSFESGRLAGLGEKYETIPARQPSWRDTNRPATLDFPVYSNWRFATTDSSFEDLVSKMKTASANPNIGIRTMDVGRPGYVKANGTPGVGKPNIPATPGVMGLEGALRTPATVSTAYLPDGKSDEFQKDVKDLLNLYDQSASVNTPYAAASDTDPVLTIPLYGWPYVNPKGSKQPSTTLNDTQNWYPVINFDPRNRAAAGLGTQVVQEQQEKLMQSAWYQLQTLQKARNHFGAVGSIMQRMLDRLTNTSLVAEEDFISMARNMTSRIKTAEAKTVLQSLTSSATPNAIINSATRRIMRGNGNIINKLSQGEMQPVAKLSLKTLNARLDTNTLTNFRFKFNPGILINFPILVIQTPFDRAFNDFNERVPKLSTPSPLIMFHFAQVQKNIQATIRLAPFKLIRTKLNLSATQVSGSGFTNADAPVLKPPSEFLGQPVFPNPMYEPLWKLDKEWFLPNINLIEDNTVTLLETNVHFINSYMLGINQEIGREMLWRQFPADLSTTFFRNFWRSNDGDTATPNFDIDPVEKWIGTPAPQRKSNGGQAKLVLTLRGELLRKFPNTVIVAVQLERDKTSGKLLFATQPGAANFKFPSFRADLPPDLQFLGFDLLTADVLAETSNPSTANSKAWYFIFMEPVGEPRFGLDAEFRPGNSTVYNRNDLSWDHFKNPTLPDFLMVGRKPEITDPQAAADKALWGKDAAAMAALLFQQPFAMLVKATDMIKT